jgi:hypothetical protein
MEDEPMNAKHFSNLSARCSLMVIVLALVIPAFAQDIPASADGNFADANHPALALSACFATRGVQYRLVEGSTLVDECPVCALPAVIPIPITGSFWLIPVQRDMWFSYFVVRNLRFMGAAPQSKYVGRMDGKYQIGGDFAFVHQMALHGRINEFQDLSFDSGVVFPRLSFPWIEIDLIQLSPADPLHTFRIHLVAVPWPAVWFSTERGFHPSDPNKVGKAFVSDGDLLGLCGRVIRTNNDLTRRLGIMPVVPGIGLDAVMRGMPSPASIADRCRREIWFSSERDIFSETLGPLRHGDLLSDAGRIVLSFEDLIGPFCPQPPVADYGLDAVAPGPQGRLLFSIEHDFFSECLGVNIGHGDLLLQGGHVFRTNAQLLARFKPIDPPAKDLGLDAVYLWPHGEIWFSTEIGFNDARFGHIGHGDLLSNYGMVVARNRDLLCRFEPLEDLADFGLDSLQILWPRLIADFDGDGDVDIADFAAFASAWSKRSGDALWDSDYDIDAAADDAVDILDLAVFADNWLIYAE